jgi:hypothetical protein
MGDNTSTSDTTADGGYHGGFRIYTDTSTITVQFPRKPARGTE